MFIQQVGLPLAISLAALLVSLVSAVIAYSSFRLNRRAFETGGHDIAVHAEVEMGGVSEMYPNQPVHLVADLYNGGRGPVTVVDIQLEFAPWDSISYATVTERAMVPPSKLEGRIEGTDHKRYVFEVDRSALQVVVTEDTLSIKSIRRLTKKHDYPVWVGVRLGNGEVQRIQLRKRDGRIVRDELLSARSGRERSTDYPPSALPDRSGRPDRPARSLDSDEG